MNFDRHAFWKDPAASDYPKWITANCCPEIYLGLSNVTELVVWTLTQYVDPTASVLELGCGTGRNLAGLAQAGFTKLAGIEINPHAVDLGLAAFPELAGVDITIAPVEETPIEAYDVIFTQGFLMHLPDREFDAVAAQMRKQARRLIMTIEGVRTESFHAWPHDYQKVFERDGWKQVEAHTCEKFTPLPAWTTKRVFTR